MTARMRRRMGWRRITVSAFLESVALTLVLLSVIPSAAGQTQSAAGTTKAGSTAAPATASETIERTFLDSSGNQQTVDGPRNFSVSVSDTSGLQNRQVITVNWSGAHPTGGLISDEQGQSARYAEYPVVLMECRGVDSTKVPVSKRISPSTCWTATPQERTLSDSGGTPLWYLDRYTTAAQRVPLVNAVPDYVADCPNGASNEWLEPFNDADGHTYGVGPGGCAGMPPDMSVEPAPGALPSDTTYAATDTNGDGTAKFSIETADANAALGCSATVACSLVVIPIEGLSCDPAPANGNQSLINACETTGVYSAGEPNESGQPQNDTAVTGALWYLPSNWRNHVSIPLSFAPTTAACQDAASAPVAIYGSEVLAEATAQWNPHFCLSSSGFDVTHVLTAEPEAKDLLVSGETTPGGGIKAAFEAEPPAEPASTFFPSPTVQAPVGVSGFAISYVIDNTDGQPYLDLKLDARLLAKLLTESYPGMQGIEAGEQEKDSPYTADPTKPPPNPDYAMRNNPLTIWDDPEFKALNPKLKVNDSDPLLGNPAPASTLFSIFGQSDVIYALTSYVNADPEARAWLNGTPDPWGTVVNPSYRGIELPVDSWSLNDTMNQGPLYDGAAGNPNFCLNALYNNWQVGEQEAEQKNPKDPKNSVAAPTAVRPYIDAPESSFEQVGLNLQFGIAPSQTTCTLSGPSFNWQSVGIEPVGARFLIGIVPLALADEYGLETAALQTYVGPDASPSLADLSDRVFVPPTSSALAQAASLLQPNTTDGTWTLPFNKLASDQTTMGAYPGTLLVSMDVPTRGLDASDAKDLGQYLSYAAGPGQVPGTGTGELPAGYLPMTAADGLGRQVAYTEAAAKDVSAQNGEVPPLVPSTGTPTSRSTTTVAQQGSPETTGISDGGSVGGTSGTGAAAGSPSGTASSNTTQPGTGSAGTTGNGTPPRSGSSGPESILASPAALQRSANANAFGSGMAGFALPLAFVVAILGGAVAASDRLPWRFRKRPA